MNKIIAVFYFGIILINTFSGILLTNYNLINWLTANLVLLLNYFYTISLNRSNASDGMKIGVNITNTIILIISLIDIYFMPSKLYDNYHLIVLSILLSFQFLIMYSSEIFKNIADRKSI